MEQLLAKALGQDVSQLATTEKQLLLSRLLGRLAHEIRNPLSSLDIHVQLLEEDLAQLAPQAGEKMAGRLEIIHGELHRLDNIVKQFLRLAGPSALDLEPVDLVKIVGHVCELLRPQATEREIDLVVQMDGSLPHVQADPVQLTQALMNLVINALQAVERRGRIEVRVRHPGEGGFVDIDVADSGPGVPRERQSAIFEPFFTTRSEGSGLGLWIAQQIAVAHGGEILVANTPDGGAVFTLKLPLPTQGLPRG